MIRLDIQCNNPDNGIFDGVARAIQVGRDGRIELACLYFDWSPKLKEGDGWIRIGGKKIRCVGSVYGVGNWCWNAYYCETDDVEALLNWPKFRKWFDIEAGPVKVFKLWKEGKPLKFKRQFNGGRCA